jgi:hypothetical protein
LLRCGVYILLCTIVGEQVCYNHIGCFQNTPPYTNSLGKLPKSPDHIRPSFTLHTRQNDFLHFLIRDRNCLPFVSTRVHPPDVGGVRVANYLYFSVFLYFVFRRPVSCIPNVASVSGLSILDCTFGFL